MLRILFAVSIAFGLASPSIRYHPNRDRLNVNIEANVPTGRQSTAKEYVVWRVFAPDGRGYTRIVMSLDEQKFNGRDLRRIGAQINRQFPEAQKLKVGLLDDSNIAQLFIAGKVSYQTYERAERARYVFDRVTGKGYIEFAAERGGSRTRITIN